MSGVRGGAHPESMRATAHRLRREGLSICAVAAELGIAESTAKDWLKGTGQARYVKTCWCGEVFTATRWDALSCCQAHTVKRLKVFGPVRGSAPATMADATGATGP